MKDRNSTEYVKNLDSHFGNLPRSPDYSQGYVANRIKRVKSYVRFRSHQDEDDIFKVWDSIRCMGFSQGEVTKYPRNLKFSLHHPYVTLKPLNTPKNL